MIVAIDAGHGGLDPGAVGPSGYKESGIVLNVAIELGVILEENSIKYLLTRSYDTHLTPRERVDACKPADIVISIHCNSFERKDVEGTEVIYRLGSENSKVLSKCIHNELVNGGHKARGVKASPSPAYPRNLFILRENHDKVAVLVELDFISNPIWEKRLINSEKAHANYIYLGLKSYLDGKKAFGCNPW